MTARRIALRLALIALLLPLVVLVVQTCVAEIEDVQRTPPRTVPRHTS